MLSWFAPIVEQFVARLNAGQCHHALLLNGPRGIGKQQLLVDLAQHILCHNAHQACDHCQSCLLFSAGTHPDHYVIQSEKQIGVDDIRQGIEKLHSHAQLSHTKVLLIHDADTMTESAANALLKTLEEPNQQTYLVLSTSSGRVLPTILSRCEKHTLTLPSTPAIQAWLRQEHDLVVDEATINAYQHAPFSVLHALSEPDSLSYQEFCDDFAALEAQSITALDFGLKWQSDVQNCLRWLQQQWLRKAQTVPEPHQQRMIKVRLEHVIALTPKMHHAGTNKALLLAQVLTPFTE
jgi:DNA polymerase-3 subunit delta'